MRYVGIVNDSELLSRSERLKPISAKFQVHVSSLDVAKTANIPVQVILMIPRLGCVGPWSFPSFCRLNAPIAKPELET